MIRLTWLSLLIYMRGLLSLMWAIILSYMIALPSLTLYVPIPIDMSSTWMMLCHPCCYYFIFLYVESLCVVHGAMVFLICWVWVGFTWWHDYVPSWWAYLIVLIWMKLCIVTFSTFILILHYFSHCMRCHYCVHTPCLIFCDPITPLAWFV